jgi:hypothetical protein
MMATTVYESATIRLIDDTEIYITPLKIKFLREFMEAFEKLDDVVSNEDAIAVLSECARIAMKQYYPLIKTIEDLEDSVDMPTVYKIIDIAAGIKVNEKKEETVKDQAQSSGETWKTLDLVTLESEVFLLGIWKDYEELETSLSMPEIIAILSSKRDLDYQEKKFFAAIQGVDLDKQSGKNKGNEWEQMKARVFSGGGTSDPNDVLSLQGQNAVKAGFGIGMGLDYKKL